MYDKLHSYHRYVTGHNFFKLHTKFEELYNEASLHIDELAERLLALGGEPVATMKKALGISTVSEAQGNEKAEQMVVTLVEDFSQIVAELKNGMELAEQTDDETTGDMLLAIHSSLEKHLWMLKSFLG